MPTTARTERESIATAISPAATAVRMTTPLSGESSGSGVVTPTGGHSGGPVTGKTVT